MFKKIVLFLLIIFTCIIDCKANNILTTTNENNSKIKIILGIPCTAKKLSYDAEQFELNDESILEEDEKTIENIIDTETLNNNKPSKVETNEINISKNKNKFYYESPIEEINKIEALPKDSRTKEDEEINKINKAKYFAVKEIYKKIVRNLELLNMFDIEYDERFCIDLSRFIYNGINTEMMEFIMSDKFIGNDLVLNSEIEIIDSNKLKLTIYLWDVIEGRFVEGKFYTFSYNENDYAIVGNRIADIIFKVATGEPKGLFDSKILYVSESGNVLHKEKQINVMQFDGSHNSKLSINKTLKINPIFSKSNFNEIFYVEKVKDKKHADNFFVIKDNLTKNKVQIIKTKNSTMTSAPNFSPVKNQLVVASTDKNGYTNLVLFDFNKKTNKQLTNSEAICTAPSFNPDGNKIVYTSDKDGIRKLYILDLVTNQEKILTANTGVYDNPSWSPNGKYISFVKITNNKFKVGITDEEGLNEVYLKEAFLIEGVKWSPNSRFLIYTKQTSAYGKGSIPKIYILDIVTGNEIQLPTPENMGASDPDWIMNE